MFACPCRVMWDFPSASYYNGVSLLNALNMYCIGKMATLVLSLQLCDCQQRLLRVNDARILLHVYYYEQSG